MEAKQKYEKALQDYKDVSRGGKHYHACSFMDISVRSDRLDKAKQELIIALGTEQFNKLYAEKEI